MNRLFVSLALVLAFAVSAPAQQLTLQISGGRVNLDATSVPAGQILAEWARIGGTTIVNGDKVIGPPITLKLVDVPEQRALDLILRNAAGFMAAPRQASAAPGASNFDRIFILATSSGAAAASKAAANAPPGVAGANNAQRRPAPRPPTLATPPADDTPGDDPEPEPDQADTGVRPVFTFPAPPGSATPGGSNPVFVPMNNTGQPGVTNAPVISLQPGPDGPTIYNFVPNSGIAAPNTLPNSGFTVIGTPTPGMIQPAPVATPTPTPPTRPPGR